MRSQSFTVRKTPKPPTRARPWLQSKNGVLFERLLHSPRIAFRRSFIHFIIMSTAPSQAEGMERKEVGDLKISAAIANNRSSEPSSSSLLATSTSTTGLHHQAKLFVDTATTTGGDSTTAIMRTTESPPTTATAKKLPPSPLVTPPMGSNPSEAAQQAVSPRNLNNPNPPEHPPQLLAAATSPGGSSSRKGNNKQEQQQKGIPHVYHDYSKLSGPGPAYIRKKTGGVTQREYHKKTQALFLSYISQHLLFFQNGFALTWFLLLTAFPDKLHEMLAQESSDDPASAIVSWLPHGRAFIVRKPKEFTTQVMPK